MKIQPSLKTVLIVIGSIAVTSLGVLASDFTQGVEGRLAGLVTGGVVSECAAGSVLYVREGMRVCIDQFEASPSSACPFVSTNSNQHTRNNIADASCIAESVADVEPWRYVSYTQAQQLCARSGKRLLTNAEWYQLALSISDPHTCVLATPEQQPAVTGTGCLTATGVADVVGNVWEWTADTVIDGQYNERQLPSSGYVQLVDDTGVVVETGEQGNIDFGNDYAWVNTTGVRGFLRGGFYGSGEDGGIFAQNMSVGLDFAAVGVGFRCARDL